MISMIPTLTNSFLKEGMGEERVGGEKECKLSSNDNDNSNHTYGS